MTAVLDAPREKVFRCWTEPNLIKKWFAPQPWTITEAEVDLRVGGRNAFAMQSPEGETSSCPCEGVYLEVVKNEKLVTTDAFTRAWIPSQKPFTTTVILFEEAEANKTRYSVHIYHWTKEDCDEHEKMGFHQGWAITTKQLNELGSSI